METKLINTGKTLTLNISESLENKISYLLREFPSTEWSGVLFYTYKTDPIELTAVDLYLMDIGNSVFTEYEFNAEIAGYIAENPELVEAQTGLIHSHHSMSTNFSSTDMKTLEDEGKDQNHFLSLIVNNAKSYSAKFTTKQLHKVHGKRTIIEYGFNNEAIETEKYVNTEQVAILYDDCKIVMPDVLDFNDIASRISEIEGKKKAQTQTLFNTEHPAASISFSPETAAMELFDVDVKFLGEAATKDTLKKMVEHYKNCKFNNDIKATVDFSLRIGEYTNSEFNSIVTKARELMWGIDIPENHLFKKIYDYLTSPF